MSHAVTVRRSLAVSATLALMACGASAAPAFADPGNGNGNGNGGASQSAPGQTKDKKDKGKGKGHQGNPGHQGQGNGPKGDGPKGHQGNPGNQGRGNGPKGDGPKGNQGQGNQSQGNQGNAGGAGDPAGNNGTVKIAGLGELDGIPNNTPHPGCTFQVEWYGFDEGPDVVSQVSFAMHAPTADVALSVAGDTSVFVGGDPASGAGTDTGLDGVETYTLTFDGAPHPKQGYHLKLTVATPRSQGNDTKTKVFWVEPCETAPGEESGESAEGGRGDESEDLVGSGVSNTDVDLDGRGEQSEQGVLGTKADFAETSTLKGAAARADSPAVPLSVDAGEGGALRDLASSPLALLITGLGILLAMAGALARRRTGAAPTS
ncbi:MAG: hypothetical protein Q8O61_02650 [Nocardioides sp.]|nr:hypothetical protein [Nocardioides sp.]